MRTLFAITAFVAATLLFVVQPMVGRMLLPSIGGSAVVWNTAMVFYQAMLLLGYVYAHISTRYLGVKRQPYLHMVLMLAALVFLPIGIEVANPDLLAGAPIRWMIWTLLTHIGLPFFVVSAAAPMLQRWYAATDQEDAANPYQLYAASNAGSLIALVMYPLAMEPWLTLSAQGVGWTIGFALLLLLTLAAAVALRKRPALSGIDEDDAPSPSASRRGFWVFWSFIPSSLLLGVTHHLTIDLASVPLLWVIPLIIYLATFVLAFSGQRWCSSRYLIAAAVALLYTLIGVFATHERDPIYVVVGINLAAFATASLVYHRALYDTRPAAKHLTDFYVWVSVGGVMGGIFNALIAPEIFDSYFEYPLTLGVAIAALSTVRVFDAEGRKEVAGTLLAGSLSLALVLWLTHETWDSSFRMLTLAALGFAPFVMHLVRPVLGPVAVGIACILIASPFVRSDSLLEARSPYGAYRVLVKESEIGKFHTLIHGWTNHGSQSLDERLERLPISYYHPTSPMGTVVAGLDKGQPIAVVGLGAGVLAGYGSEKRPMTFFEIDPVVAEIAANPKYFTYLKHCGEHCDVKVGDGRLLMHDVEDGSLGLLVLDAYNSDSIPIHLITLEAMDLYLEKLAPDGIILFHVSNKYIELDRLVANLAAQRELVTLRQQYWPRESHLFQLQVTSSDVVIVARNLEALAPYDSDPRWERTQATPGQPIWTDDYANLFTYLSTATDSD